MDEEQVQKKITLNNFFEQIVEIDRVANAALTNSNNLRSQLNAVQLDLKRLVESLQVNFDSGVQNVQTQINEVTNVIVDDQRIKQSETDALEQQIFAQEDQLQKQTKGQKAKPTSSDGNLLQRAASSIQNKAKSNLLATGLFGASFLLAGLKGKKPESDYEKNKKEKRSEVKSDNNFNFLPSVKDLKEGLDTLTLKPIFDQFFKPKDVKENKEIDKQVDSYVKERKVPINKDLTIDKSMVNNNVVQEIVEKKKPDLVTSNNEEFNKRKIQLINRLKYDPREVVAAANKSYNEGGTEVVNENVNTGQKRGEVRVEQPIVKSSLSSVSVINIAEDNSVSNLSI